VAPVHATFVSDSAHSFCISLRRIILLSLTLHILIAYVELDHG